MRAASRAVYLVAGEPSGDRLGARLMVALARRDPDLRWLGVGGPAMAAAGLASLFPLSDLSVMGFAEVLPHLPRLVARLRQTTRDIRHRRPNVVVTIDSPDFTLRVARAIRREGIPVVHYVAPQVWAHRAGRAREMAGYIDHVMALLPFEPPYFESAGLPCTFVGHPAAEEGFGAGDGAAFRARHGLRPEQPVLVLLPGSRLEEVARLLPPFGDALARLGAAIPGLAVVVPTVPTVAALVRDAANRWAGPRAIIVAPAERRDAFAAATAAMAASGTVTLELGLAGVPAVIAYRTSAATAWLARRLLKVRHVGLVNLLVPAAPVPELLQERCTPEALAASVLPLLVDAAARRVQIDALAGLADRIAGPTGAPSQSAADVVLAAMAKGTPRAAHG